MAFNPMLVKSRSLIALDHIYIFLLEQFKLLYVEKKRGSNCRWGTMVDKLCIITRTNHGIAAGRHADYFFCEPVDIRFGIRTK